MEGGKHTNHKTGLSFDTTTICERKRKGKPCAYCYVETGRKTGFNAKREVDRTPYDGWVLRLRPETVAKQNAQGGVRMFASADYVVAHRKDVQRFLDDCLVRGLYAKAITKNLKFVQHFHDHPAVKVIQLSIDARGGVKNGGSQISKAEADEYREVYDKVVVRSVVLSPDEVTPFGSDINVDILTLNHGQNGFYWFNRQEVASVATRYPEKTCCTSGHCSTCRIACTVPPPLLLPRKMFAAVA